MSQYLRILRAEHLKLKRTFTRKLILTAPLLTLFLCFILMGGRFFQSGSLNWWYTMILPGALTLMCSGVLRKDGGKLRYRPILSLPISASLSWLGKIGEVVILFFGASMCLWVALFAVGLLLPGTISAMDSLLGTLAIFATFLWQIPFCLFLADRVGTFVTLIISMIGNFGAGVIFLSTSDLWWIPYGIPSRLMCAIIQVLPNGLPVPSGDPLLDQSVILPGLLINIGWFVLLSFITAKAFQGKESK